MDSILFNGRITTLDPAKPSASAVAIDSRVFVAVGSYREIMALRGAKTKVLDLRGRPVIPGLNDSHTHLIRGGLNYNMELRWDGVPSLAEALAMLREQARRTPAPQWVRVVGGWSEFQFAERRMPTLAEINAAAPDIPVFVLHLYARAMLNAATPGWWPARPPGVKVPAVLTTVAEKSFSGPMFTEVTAPFPGQDLIDRTSMNTWEDANVIKLINAIGKDRLVFAGLWTSVCIVGPVLSALDQGYQAYVIADACGDVSAEAHDRAIDRMVQAGARPMTSLQYQLELQRDRARGATNELTSGIAKTFGGAYGLGVI